MGAAKLSVSPSYFRGNHCPRSDDRGVRDQQRCLERQRHLVDNLVHCRLPELLCFQRLPGCSDRTQRTDPIVAEQVCAGKGRGRIHYRLQNGDQREGSIGASTDHRSVTKLVREPLAMSYAGVKRFVVIQFALASGLPNFARMAWPRGRPSSFSASSSTLRQRWIASGVATLLTIRRLRRHQGCR